MKTRDDLQPETLDGSDEIQARKNVHEVSEDTLHNKNLFEGGLNDEKECETLA